MSLFDIGTDVVWELVQDVWVDENCRRGRFINFYVNNHRKGWFLQKARRRRNSHGSGGNSTWPIILAHKMFYLLRLKNWKCANWQRRLSSLGRLQSSISGTKYWSWQLPRHSDFRWSWNIHLEVCKSWNWSLGFRSINFYSALWNTPILLLGHSRWKLCLVMQEKIE